MPRIMALWVKATDECSSCCQISGEMLYQSRLRGMTHYVLCRRRGPDEGPWCIGPSVEWHGARVCGLVRLRHLEHVAKAEAG